MSRRSVEWILRGLLMVVLAIGGLGCKQEEGAIPEGEDAKMEMAAPEAKVPAEEKVSGDTVLFEEQEGVQQEDETNYE